jgi:two-component system catabolic regulation response regulator CreB
MAAPGSQGEGRPGGEARVRAGEFGLDAERCEVRFRGVKLELTRYEYRLLGVFLARPGRVFSRDELMAQVWEDPGASLDRTVDAHIKTLRAKLRAIAPEADPIQTHRGLGYALRG